MDISPSDTFFKTEFKNNLKETKKYAQESFNKTNALYKSVLKSSNKNITNYKSDIENSKEIAEEILKNIKSIEKRMIEKDKLDEQIKTNLSLKTEKKIKNIEEETNESLFENLSSIFF